MKTLEQWQKELPDYEFSQSLERICGVGWESWEVRFGDRWLPTTSTGGFWGAFIEGRWMRGCDLLLLGAIFRRKKERQREFKLAVAHHFAHLGRDGVDWTEIPAGTTLTVNEWGGE